MPRGFSLMLIATFAILFGCQSALLNMKKETEILKQSVSKKEQELQGLERRQTGMEEEKNKLLSELDSKQFEIDNLSAHLNRLRKENTGLAADTEDQKRKQNEIDNRLESYQEEIVTLEKNSTLTEKQKQERIEELKKEIKLYLEMGLR